MRFRSTTSARDLAVIGDQIVMEVAVETEEVEEEEVSDLDSADALLRSAMADAEKTEDKAVSAGKVIDHRLRETTGEDVDLLVTEKAATRKVAAEETMTMEVEVADLAMAAEEPTSTARDRELGDKEEAEEAVPADPVPDQEVREVEAPEAEPLLLSERRCFG